MWALLKASEVVFSGVKQWGEGLLMSHQSRNSSRLLQP